MVKNPPANSGDTGDAGLTSVSGKIPWKRKWQPTPVFLLGKSHRQRSLVGYTPQGRKETQLKQRSTYNDAYKVIRKKSIIVKK